MKRQQHWDRVYSRKLVDEVSWYQASAAQSLALIARCGLDRDAPIIDIGGGASVLVDELLALGYRDLSVLDVSARAIELAAARLGARAAGVHWRLSDITEFRPERLYSLWHDRAVFHFLTEAGDRHAYQMNLRQAMRPGGWVIIATFGLDGPSQCSGLDVVRYDAEALCGELGDDFRLQDVEREHHATPAGARQSFIYCRFCYQPSH